MARATHFMPRHCLEPLLNGTRYLRSCEALGCSQRSGSNSWPLGKCSGLLCIMMDVMPTGVCAKHQPRRNPKWASCYLYADRSSLCTYATWNR